MVSEGVVQTMRQLRHRARSLVDAHPAIYFPLCCLRPRVRERVVRASTEIVIEGFPRSANGFAVAAFTLAQQRPVRIAHHLHAPAQVAAGVEMGIPTLVLIRQPRDAVLSLSIRESSVPVKQALKDYMHFYTSIGPYHSGYVIAEFNEVITAFGGIMGRVNARFGTGYNIFGHTEENVARCFQLIEEMHRASIRAETVNEMAIGRPSRERGKRRRELEREAFRTRRARELLGEAEAIYAEFLERASAKLEAADVPRHSL